MTPRVRVGDVLQLKRRSVAVDPSSEYEEIGVRSFGKGIFHKEPVTGAELGNKRVFRIEPGDLVLSNVFAWEGAVALATRREVGKIGSHRFMTFTPKDGRIDTAWAAWFFRSEPGQELIRKASPGSAGRNRTLAIERFANLEIPLPPIDQQGLAARSLDRMCQVSEALRTALLTSEARADSIEDGWLHRAFESLPNDVTVGDVAEVVRGRGPAYEAGSGFVAVNQACVRWGRLDLSEVREVSADWFEHVPAAARVQPGDVLVNSTGEGTIGRAVLATEDASGLPFDSHVMSVRCREDKILPDFLSAYLRSPQGQGAIAKLKGANTTKQTELGKAKLEQLPVPQASLEEQLRLVSEFQDVTNLAGEIRRSMVWRRGLANALLPSTLHSAFMTIM